MNLVDNFNIKDAYLLSVIEEYITYFLEEMVKNNDLDIDFKNHINSFQYPDGTPELEIDIKGIESEIYQNIDSFLSDFNKSVLEKIDVNTSDVVSNLDIENMAISYLEALHDEDDLGNSGTYNNSYSSKDDIDAIFER